MHIFIVLEYCFPCQSLITMKQLAIAIIFLTTLAILIQFLKFFQREMEIERLSFLM